MFDVTKYCHQYHTEKLTVIDRIIPEEICECIVTRALQIVAEGKAKHIDYSGRGTNDVLDGGGDYRYEVFDMKDVTHYFSELVLLYHSLLPMLSIITHNDVITSPHPGSEITLKVYQGKGATQGWHYDTNAITALLYLTTNQEGATICEIKKHHPRWRTPQIEVLKIYPKAGSLLLMKGREVWHCSEALSSGSKVVVPLNYYLKDDTWRPDGIDELIYGGARKENVHLSQ